MAPNEAVRELPSECAQHLWECTACLSAHQPQFTYRRPCLTAAILSLFGRWLVNHQPTSEDWQVTSACGTAHLHSLMSVSYHSTGASRGYSAFVFNPFCFGSRYHCPTEKLGYYEDWSEMLAYVSTASCAVGVTK